MHMEWYNWEQVNQWHRYGLIIKNPKCQIDLHHCNGLVETIEMDISFAYIGVRMREIGMWARRDPHKATWRHAATQVSMCPWHFINPRKHTFDQSGASTQIQASTSPRKWPRNTANTHIPTLGPTWQSPRRKAVRTEPTWDRTTPQVDRLHLEAVRPHIPRGISSMDPKGIPRGLGVSSQSCPAPINRSEGGGVKNRDIPYHPRMRASLQRRGLSSVD
jgi:hypothetical protein